MTNVTSLWEVIAYKAHLLPTARARVTSYWPDALFSAVQSLWRCYDQNLARKGVRVESHRTVCLALMIGANRSELMPTVGNFYVADHMCSQDRPPWYYLASPPLCILMIHTKDSLSLIDRDMDRIHTITP